MKYNVRIDVKETGSGSVFVTHTNFMKNYRSWDEVEQELFTEKEIKRSKAKVDLILKVVKQRKVLGLTQRELADISGVQESKIANIEALNSNPRIDTLLKITTALDLELLPGTLVSASNEKKMIYNVRIDVRETDCGFVFVARYPSLKGVSGTGKTQIEALQDLEENAEAHIKFMKMDGQEPPDPDFERLE